MNPMERINCALSHKQPDRVPLALPFTFYGAKYLDMTIPQYLSASEHVVRAQILMQKAYHNDCVIAYSCAAAEFSAFGGEILYYDEGPPNAGEAIIKNFEDIERLEVPNIQDSVELRRILESTQSLKKHYGNEVPVLGVAIAPFSLPIMQMGFEKYLNLIYSRPDLLEKLLKVNAQFCIAWSNAQIEAGAAGVSLFDPMASPTMLEKVTYMTYGHETLQKVVSQIKGLVGLNFASGLALPVVEETIQTGASLMSFSCKDDLQTMKAAGKERIGLIGNLNAIDLINWDEKRIRQEVKALISIMGQDGGFILSDQHGEIPWNVSDDQLKMIAEAVNDFSQNSVIEADHENNQPSGV